MTGPFSGSPAGRPPGVWQADAHVVPDPRAARLLLDPQARRCLEPFLGRTLGVAEAARGSGVPPDVMAYRVRVLVRLGLLG